MKLAKALARRIQALREAAGLTQQEVADRGGLSGSQVSKLERGKKSAPRASTLLALAAGLGAKPGALLDDLFPAREAEARDDPKAEAAPEAAPEADSQAAPEADGKK